jgi:hypothetical protein
MKKARKQVKSMVELSMIGAGGSIALGALGSTHGQQGIAGMSSMMPAMGSVMGPGIVMGAVKNLEPKKRRKKR